MSPVWEEPPPIPGHRPNDAGKWVRELAPLMEHPKRWARIGTGDKAQMSNLASQLRRGRRERPPGFWEFVFRATGDNEGAAYARYLGPDATGGDE